MAQVVKNDCKMKRVHAITLAKFLVHEDRGLKLYDLMQDEPGKNTYRDNHIAKAQYELNLPCKGSIFENS